MGHGMQYLAHHHLTKDRFYPLDILHLQEFDKVDWEIVYQTLHEVPKIFQQLACKQVMGIGGTMEWDKSEVWKCPSCMKEYDNCGHVFSAITLVGCKRSITLSI
jgi:hypothetical protein